MSHAELISALEAIAKIGEDGVIERRETGKPTWTALAAVKEIAREAIAKATQSNRTSATILIIDADVVQRIVDEDMAGITIHAKLSGAGIDLEAYSGEDELVASNHSKPCSYCGGICPSDEDNACDGHLGDIDGLNANHLRDTIANTDCMELMVIRRQYAEIHVALFEMGLTATLEQVQAVVDEMATTDQYFVRLAQVVR